MFAVSIDVKDASQSFSCTCICMIFTHMSHIHMELREGLGRKRMSHPGPALSGWGPEVRVNAMTRCASWRWNFLGVDVFPVLRYLYLWYVWYSCEIFLQDDSEDPGEHMWPASGKLPPKPIDFPPYLTLFTTKYKLSHQIVPGNFNTTFVNRC